GTPPRPATGGTPPPGPDRRSPRCPVPPALPHARPGSTPAAAAWVRVSAPAPVVGPGTGDAAGSNRPAALRWPGPPPSYRSTAPPRSRRHQSSRGLAPAVLAVGRELLQQRGEFSLDLDHPPGLVQLGLEPLDLPP